MSDANLPALPWLAPLQARRAHYADLRLRLSGLLHGETDPIAAYATVACELHHAFAAFHWTGFYRVLPNGSLIIGPYQGGHGCLRIGAGQGVCGAVADSGRSLRLDDVESFPDHIACSSSTKSELVVPVIRPGGELLAVLDIDSDHPAAFDALDQAQIESIAADLGSRLAAP
ncbi:MAG: GAF domain-containing protein [Deltaproteobacteria bacterium]|nr:MAG: GAF domain-containing protein [Deltaproteobacteria bacterium]